MMRNLKKNLDCYQHNFQGTGIEEIFSNPPNSFKYGEEVKQIEEFVLEEEQTLKHKTDNLEFPTQLEDLNNSFGFKQDLSYFKTPKKQPGILPDTTIPRSNNSIDLNLFNSFN